jgi:hypothetical protein
MFADTLAATEAPAWTTDDDERRAVTYAAARTMVARIHADQRHNLGIAASLEALAESGDAYDASTDAAPDLPQPTTPRPDAITRQTDRDTVAGIAARVTPGTPAAVAWHFFRVCFADYLAWRRPANHRGPRPTVFGAHLLAQEIENNTAAYHATRRQYLGAVRLLAPLARDAYRDAWQSGTKATNERDRAAWTDEARATSDLLTALGTYDLAPGGHPGTATNYADVADQSPAPSLTAHYRPSGDRLAVTLYDASGQPVTGGMDLSPEGCTDLAAWRDSIARSTLSCTADTTRQRSPYATPEDRADSARAAKIGATNEPTRPGETVGPYYTRPEASKSHKQPAPRKRKASGQTGPTVAVRLTASGTRW